MIKHIWRDQSDTLREEKEQRKRRMKNPLTQQSRDEKHDQGEDCNHPLVPWNRNKIFQLKSVGASVSFD